MTKIYVLSKASLDSTQQGFYTAFYLSIYLHVCVCVSFIHVNFGFRNNSKCEVELSSIVVCVV